MREIKFRAWDEKSKVMVLLGKLFGTYNSGDYGYTDKSYGARCGEITNGRYGREEKDRTILMQYTGLKDKEGNIIGVLDVDSGEYNQFDEIDKMELTSILDLIYS